MKARVGVRGTVWCGFGVERVKSAPLMDLASFGLGDRIRK